MKIIIICLITCIAQFCKAQSTDASDTQKIKLLIDQYAKARETKDTTLLKSILSNNIDQLVSSGEWRRGIREAINGMLRSSEGNPGTRKLIVENIRLFDQTTGLADARYEISNPDGTIRKMWSSFTVVRKDNVWKIAAIRNMLPAR